MAVQVGTNLFGPQTSTLDINLTDENGLAVMAKCTGVPPTTASVFQHGCIMLRIDSGTGSQALYENTGSTAVPAWEFIGNATGNTGYFAVATNTTGTTPVNVFGATVPFSGTVTGAYITARDTTAGTISVVGASGTMTTIPKLATANAMYGSTIVNGTMTSGDTVTVVSSSVGNATVFLTFTTS